MDTHTNDGSHLQDLADALLITPKQMMALVDGTLEDTEKRRLEAIVARSPAAQDELDFMRRQNELSNAVAGEDDMDILEIDADEEAFWNAEDSSLLASDTETDRQIGEMAYVAGAQVRGEEALMYMMALDFSRSTWARARAFRTWIQAVSRLSFLEYRQLLYAFLFQMTHGIDVFPQVYAIQLRRRSLTIDMALSQPRHTQSRHLTLLERRFEETNEDTPGDTALNLVPGCTFYLYCDTTLESRPMRAVLALEWGPDTVGIAKSEVVLEFMGEDSFLSLPGILQFEGSSRNEKVARWDLGPESDLSKKLGYQYLAVCRSK